MKRVKYPKPVVAGVAAVVGAVMVGWWMHLTFLLPKAEAALEDRSFAREIRRWAPSPDPVIFFRVEAHALAFHTGRPVDTILEWENLDFWVSQPRPFYVVMDDEGVRDWPKHLKSGQLEKVIANTDLAGGSHQRPLVLMRTRPGAHN